MKFWIKIGYWLFIIFQPFLRIFLRKRITTRVFIVANNKVLLVKVWLSDGLYGLPGGGIKKGEKPSQAAIREVFEETSVKLENKDLKYQGIYKANNKFVSYDYHLYTATINNNLLTKNQLIEIVESKWLAIDLIDSALVSDEVNGALLIINSNLK